MPTSVRLARSRRSQAPVQVRPAAVSLVAPLRCCMPLAASRTRPAAPQASASLSAAAGLALAALPLSIAADEALDRCGRPRTAHAPRLRRFNAVRGTAAGASQCWQERTPPAAAEPHNTFLPRATDRVGAIANVTLLSGRRLYAARPPPGAPPPPPGGAPAVVLLHQIFGLQRRVRPRTSCHRTLCMLLSVFTLPPC